MEIAVPVEFACLRTTYSYPKRTLGEIRMRVGLLLIDGFALMSYASVIEPFRAANSLGGRTLYAWEHLSVHEAQIHASNGLTLLADHLISEAPAFDRVFVFAAGDPAAYADE